MNYFQALNVCSQKGQRGFKDDQREDVYLPIRAFDPDCLMTESNESIIDKLLDECELLIIQDSDFYPDLLKQHRNLITKHDSSAIDVTKNLGLRRHYSYALVPSRYSSLQALQGERLWQM